MSSGSYLSWSKFDNWFYLCFKEIMGKIFKFDDGLDELLQFFKEKRCVDLSSYQKSTLRRRIQKRLNELKLKDFREYKRYLIDESIEIDNFISLITVSVTQFFRDPIVFEYLRMRVLPELLEKRKSQIVKVWCIGCATGEEPYSFAILFKEIIDKERAYKNPFIVATDIDEKSISTAKEGYYSSSETLYDVKKGFLDKYFLPKNSGYLLKEEIRKMVNFYYHDIVTLTSPKEAVFTNFDFISIRNLLIYFDKALQNAVINFLKDLIKDDGYLLLVEAEDLSEDIKDSFEKISFLKLFKKRGQR
ncbi:MAG: protein-glutamate O-methyltransferase [bacterium]